MQLLKLKGIRGWVLKDTQMPSSCSGQVSNKVDALVKAVTDLSRRVQAAEERQEVGRASPSPSPSTFHHRRRAKHQGTPDKTQDVAEEVHWRVAKCMRELHAYNEAT